MPVKALNTEDHTKGLGERKAEGGAGSDPITAINEAVHAYAKEHNLDMNQAEDYDRAYAGAKEAKPELFEAKAT